MTRIGLLSDTHGLLDERVLEHFLHVDEIWHAGDIGSTEVLELLRAHKPVRAVRGNADGGDLRWMLRDVEQFDIEGLHVVLTHIGVHSGRLTWEMGRIVDHTPTQLFVYGHSHILHVQYDKARKMLCLNPGAAGKYGNQTVQTLMRFVLDNGQIKDLEVIELERR